MTPSKFTQSLLSVIAVLLFWLAIKPYVSTTVAHASAPVQYKVVRIEAHNVPMAPEEELQLNALGKDGWSLVECAGGIGGGDCVFKR